MRLCKGRWGGPHDMDVVGCRSDGMCVPCGRESDKARSHLPHRKALRARLYRENRDKRLAYARQYRAVPAHKAHQLELERSWYDREGWVRDKRRRMESRKKSLGSME